MLQCHFCVYFDNNRKFYLQENNSKKNLLKRIRIFVKNVRETNEPADHWFFKLKVHETTIRKPLIFCEANSFCIMYLRRHVVSDLQTKRYIFKLHNAHTLLKSYCSQINVFPLNLVDSNTKESIILL